MRRARQSGVSLIEMMIGITIAALLMMIGLPSMVTWLNNSQIRTAGETLLAGLTLARVEAVKRNQVVRFQLVSDLTPSCTLIAAGTPVPATGWVVSLADPSGACNAAPSESTLPKIIQAKSGGEGTSKVSVTATGASTVYFNGLGRVTSPSGAPNITQILITNPGGGTCQHLDLTNGTMRCLQINISTGGEVKMCDPAVTASDDPRKC